MDRSLAQHSFSDDCNANGDEVAEPSDYVKILTANTVENNDGKNARVLAFKNKAPAPKKEFQSSLKVLYSQQVGKKSDLIKPTRHISSAPIRILDAPDLMDDYCKLIN